MYNEFNANGTSIPTIIKEIYSTQIKNPLYNYAMTFTTIFFDLDATLYPESNGLWPAIRKKIDQYMHKRMNIPKEDIPALREYYYIHYGTTLRCLQIHYGVDPKDYLNYVHDLPLQKYLQPDLMLRQILLSIPCQKWIFTNSDRPHALRVMSLLGIEDCFDGMVDVYEMEPFCKPKNEAYEIALQRSASADPTTCAFIDDSSQNLAPAKAMGFFTVLVGQNGSHPAATRTLVTITDLPSVVPEFWL
jgi:pyrimidine 5'-nucleotidase